MSQLYIKMICLPYSRRLHSFARFSRAISRTAMANQLSDRKNLVPFSSRLKEGRALALDVWTIFK